VLLAAIGIAVIEVALDVRPWNGNLDRIGSVVLEEQHVVLRHPIKRCEARLRQDLRGDGAPLGRLVIEAEFAGRCSHATKTWQHH
jgi:hypothetical protein